MNHTLSRHTSECQDDPEILAGIISNSKDTKKRPSLKEQQNIGKRASRNSLSHSIEKVGVSHSPAKIRSRKSSRHSQSRYSSLDGLDTDDILDDNVIPDGFTDSEDDETYDIYNKAKAEQAVSMILIDFFSSQDVEETVDTLLPYLNDKSLCQTLKKIIIYPIENGDYGAYGSISDLVFGIVTRLKQNDSQIDATLQYVIEDILLNLEEYSLNCSKAEDLLSVFLARLILDDIYSERYLQTLVGKFSFYDKAGNCLIRAVEIVKKPEKINDILPVNTGYEHVENLSNKIFSILKEYLREENIENVKEKFKELNTSYYKHEIVYQCSIISATENDKTFNALLCELIMNMYENGELTQRLIKEGLVRFFQDIQNHHLKFCKDEVDDFVHLLCQNEELDLMNALNVFYNSCLYTNKCEQNALKVKQL